MAEANALARMVVEEVLHYSPVDVLLRGNVEQDEVFVERIRSIADRLCKGEPIQYILAMRASMGMSSRLRQPHLSHAQKRSCWWI